MDEISVEKPLDGQEILARSIPVQRIAGVYFLILGGEIVYVGQAVDIHGRVAVHGQTGSIAFDRYSWVECEESSLSNLEAMYVLRFTPRHNKSVPGNDRFVTAIWLKRKGLGRLKFNKYQMESEATVYLFGALQYYDLRELLRDGNFVALLQAEGVTL